MEVNFALQTLLRLVEVVPKSEYEDTIQRAFEICKQFDRKDTPFVALALKLSSPLWTSDGDIIRYGLRCEEYLAVDTEALEMIQQGKSLDEVRMRLERKYIKRKGGDD